MNTSEIRAQLHDYIDKADDKHLQAIYVLLEDEIDTTSGYDTATISLLHERRENYIKGVNKSHTVGESLTFIRAARK